MVTFLQPASHRHCNTPSYSQQVKAISTPPTAGISQNWSCQDFLLQTAGKGNGSRRFRTRMVYLEYNMLEIYHSVFNEPSMSSPPLTAGISQNWSCQHFLLQPESHRYYLHFLESTANTSPNSRHIASPDKPPYAVPHYLHHHHPVFSTSPTSNELYVEQENQHTHRPTILK